MQTCTCKHACTYIIPYGEYVYIYVACMQGVRVTYIVPKQTHQIFQEDIITFLLSAPEIVTKYMLSKEGTNATVNAWFEKPVSEEGFKVDVGSDFVTFSHEFSLGDLV